MLRIISPKTHPSGVSFNRKYQPLRALEKAGFPVQVIYFDPMNPDEFFEVLKVFKPQVYFECSPSAAEYTSIKFIKEHCPDMKVILDFDDAPAKYVLPTNPAYAYLGEVETDTWKDRVTMAAFSGYEVMFDVERNKRNNERILEMKKMADLILAPCQKLADELSLLNNNVKVIPNTINFGLYRDCREYTEKVRIGWVLGFSHIGDWMELKDSIASVLNEYDNTEFVLWSNTVLPLDNFPLDRVEKYDTVGILDGYFNLFSNLNLDIGIAHVAENAFNSFKSDLKVSEYAAIGAMPLASNKLYNEYIKDGVDGVLYGTPGDLRHKLGYYIRKADTRRKIAQAAKDRVHRERDLTGSLPVYFEALIETAESV